MRLIREERARRARRPWGDAAFFLRTFILNALWG